jgi:uncharacterized SAM-dependent methyltransferase
VTAAFNLNLLQRMNRELSANFDMSTFAHLAFYNREQHQIEMHLRSERDQQVILRDLDLQTTFQQGETIHTEISRKFDLTKSPPIFLRSASSGVGVGRMLAPGSRSVYFTHQS